jgi:hypothetical protein
MDKKEEFSFKEHRDYLCRDVLSALEAVAKHNAVEDIIIERPLVAHSRLESSIEVKEPIIEKESALKRGVMRVYVYTKNGLGRKVGCIANVIYNGTKSSASAIKDYIRKIRLNDKDCYSLGLA